jgi:hypothetical protein
MAGPGASRAIRPLGERDFGAARAPTAGAMSVGTHEIKRRRFEPYQDANVGAGPSR